MEVTSTNVFENHATSSGGGGRLDGGSEIMLRESCALGNNVANIGGGFSLDTGLAAEIEELGTAIIRNNSAVISGGGVHVNAVANSGALPAVITLKKLQIIQKTLPLDRIMHLVVG